MVTITSTTGDGTIQSINPPTNYQFLHMIGFPGPAPTNANRSQLYWYSRREKEINSELGLFTWINKADDAFIVTASKKILVAGHAQAASTAAGDRVAIMSTRDVINDGAGSPLPANSPGIIETLANSLDQAGIGNTVVDSMTEGNALTNGANHIRAMGDSNSAQKFAAFCFVMDIGESLWVQRPAAVQSGEWSSNSSYPISFEIMAIQVK